MGGARWEVLGGRCQEGQACGTVARWELLGGSCQGAAVSVVRQPFCSTAGKIGWFSCPPRVPPPTAPDADEGGEGHGQHSLASVLARRSFCDEEGQGVVGHAGAHGQSAEQGAGVGQRQQFFDLDFDLPVKYDVVNRLLMKQIPSSDEGFMIKLRAASGETEPETLEDRDPCDNSTGGAPSPSAVAPHAAPASGTSAIALTPPVVASAACASRPPPAGLLALKLATLWWSPSPQGGLGSTVLPRGKW